MTTITNHSEYTAAVNEAKLHDYRYFTLNAPTISDEQYDALYFAIQDYETAHPNEVLADSPTQQCYSQNGNGKRQVARRTACLSMKKIHDAKTMVKYLRTQLKATHIDDRFAHPIDVEWKFDGDTVALVYLNGRLAEATYGHGKELMGNDCMNHIKHVQGVPQHVTEWANIDRVEVRGEVIINNANFEAYTGKKKAHRTTCSSFMNKKVAVAQECRLLEFHPFRVIGNHGVLPVSHCYIMDMMADYGFIKVERVGSFEIGKKYSDEELEQTIEDIVCEAENVRDTLPFPTDGLVFKFDDYSVYDLIGTTDHDAKYNCAFKFRPVHVAETTYRGHYTTIGETGKVTYIATFDPVVLNGSTFDHASCGSEDTFNAKHLTPGDRIQVSLHGDITAFVDGTIEPQCPSVLPTDYAAPASPYIAPATNEATITPEPICAPSNDSPIIIAPAINHRRPTRSRRNAPRNIGRRSDVTDRHSATFKPKHSTLRTIAAYALAIITLVAIAYVGFALIGAAVFFAPLLAGAFK